MIRYEVSLKNRHLRLLEVVLTVEDTKQITCQFPSWIPGSYLIRDFSKHVTINSISATAKNQEVTCKHEKLNNHTYQITATKVATISVKYEIYAYDFSVRGAYIDNSYAYFTGANCFFEIKEMPHEPSELILQDLPSDWQVATTMPIHPAIKGAYCARDYQHLIDCPLLMGHYTENTFDVVGTPHRLAVVGEHEGQLTTLIEDLQKICKTHFNLFAEFPFKEYLFILIVTENGYGGLEHASSSMNMISRINMPSVNVERKDYIDLLGLLSHEYFHSWNVKRIKPKEFTPYQLDKITPTTLLWVFEGFTSYYDDLGLVRSGVITQAEYLTQFCQTLSALKRSEGRHKQTITDSSYDAWTKFYQQNENSLNSTVSYYSKGALVAFCLDMELRNSTQKQSLDDVMRYLWQHYGKPEQGVSEQDLQTQLCHWGKDSMRKLLDLCLYSTDELPLEQYLNKLSLQVSYLPTTEYSVMGAFCETELPKAGNHHIGIRTKVGAIGAKILNVWHHSAAAKAGLWAHDEIIAINGYRVKHSNIAQILGQFLEGDTVTCHYFRQNKLHETKVMIEKALCHTAFMQYSEQENTLRHQWLQHET